MIKRNMFFGILTILIFTAFIVANNSLAQNAQKEKLKKNRTSTSDNKYDDAAF